LTYGTNPCSPFGKRARKKGVVVKGEDPSKGYCILDSGTVDGSVGIERKLNLFTQRGGRNFMKEVGRSAGN